jgi:DNA polymerase
MLDGIRRAINTLSEPSSASITSTMSAERGTPAKPAKVAKPGRAPDVSAAKVLLKLPPFLLKLDPATAGEIPRRVEVFLDFETRNVGGCDLTKAGAHRYAADPATEVVVLCYHHAGEDYRWTPDDGLCEPLAILAADPDAIFVSHNVQFDAGIWACIMVAKFGFPPILAERWVDTMALCAYHAQPLGLDNALTALDLPVEKDKEGSRLARSLSRHNSKTRNYPDVTPGIRNRVAQYCRTDVGGCRAIYGRLGPLPERERQLWLLDRKINDRGIAVDLDFVRAAKRIIEGEAERLVAECRELTGLNPSQVLKLRQWLIEQGCDIDSLKKSKIQEYLRQSGLPEVVRRSLEIRLVTAASSHKKLDAVLHSVG